MSKSKSKQSKPDKPKSASYPRVSPDVCEKCPIQCPDGVAYMAYVNVATKPTKGVVCRKSYYEQRAADGLDMFKSV